MINRYNTNQARRQQRVRARIARFSERPRLSVYRSNNYTYAQLIDLTTGHVLAQASDIKMDSKKTKTERAFEVGKELAKVAMKNKITTAVFDRGSYKFHGRVKAVCEGARSENFVI